MGEKFDAMFDKLGETIDTWVEEFKTNPVKTAVKVLILIYVFKKAKALIREIR